MTGGFEAFVAPVIAKAASQLLDRAPRGWLLAGGVTTFALFAMGLVLFGIASWRADVFPRRAAVLLIVGSAAGLLAGSPPFQVPLALGVGWIGLRLCRSNDPAAARPKPD